MSNLSEEEKKAINQLKADTNFYDYELKNGNYIYDLFKIEVYKKDVDVVLNLIDRLQKENKELKELHNKICEEFLKYDWKNSNNKEISNQVKCLYNSIYGEDLLKE